MGGGLCILLFTPPPLSPLFTLCVCQLVYLASHYLSLNNALATGLALALAPLVLLRFAEHDRHKARAADQNIATFIAKV